MRKVILLVMLAMGIAWTFVAKDYASAQVWLVGVIIISALPKN